MKLSVEEPGPPCHLYQQNGSTEGSGEGEHGGSSTRKAVKLPDPGTKGGLELRRECGIASHLAYLGWALVKGPPTACRLVPGQQGPSPLPAGN